MSLQSECLQRRRERTRSGTDRRPPVVDRPVSARQRPPNAGNRLEEQGPLVLRQRRKGLVEAGHLPQIEQPEATFRELDRFLDGTGFLIVALDRPDVLLTGDLALRRAVERAYGLDHRPTDAEMLELAEHWRPYRSLAVSYLFASEFDEPAAGLGT